MWHCNAVIEHISNNLKFYSFCLVCGLLEDIRDSLDLGCFNIQNFICHDQLKPLLSELFSKGHGNCDVNYRLHAYFIFVNWVFIDSLSFFLFDF